MMEIFRYRDLVLALVSRELKVRYRRSIIGFTWTMLQPLLMMLVLQVVFNSLFRFRLDYGNYPVYALSGILFWNFFSQSIVASMNSLKGSAAILRKLPVPKEVFPLATVISGVINLVFALVPLILILVVTHHPITPALLFLPVSILLAALFTLGAGLLLSPLSVFFSDVVELIGVLLSILMYLTPIFYPMKILEGSRYRPLVRFNPVRSILEVFRDPIYLGKVPPLSHLSVCFGIALIALVLGGIAFRRSSDRIPFYI
ncbi:MAG: lipopolysaccharide transport system permease protein [Acidobacteriota bacterium]|jgi:ABC-type polysaccharide/polyol phosphate export permease|nr:lipopolysaccharide transport system permease protein [Acidobacteriota bacterium]